jgi:O-antigen/teichoic acid export membrane protein
MKLEGVFISKIIAPLIIVLILLPYFLKHIKPGFEKASLFGLVKYSFPIMLASFVITLLNQVDRYILGYYTDLNEVGIFGLAGNISGLINFLIISPFSLAFTVLSWKKLKDENAKRFYTKNITYLFLGVIYISAIIALFTPHLIKIFALRTDYWIASKYVPWMILSMPFYGIHFIGVFSFYVTKKTKYVLYSYVIALIVNIGLDLAVIPYLTIYGAVFVRLFSFFILCLVIYQFSKSNYFFDYEWSKIFTLLIVYTAVVLPFFYFTFSSRVTEIILKFAALLLFPFILYLFRFYEAVEIKSIKGFINKYVFRLKY